MKADYYICPGCGEEIKVGSKGCAKCNNLDPWEIEETEIYDGVDLPEDDPDLNYRSVSIHPLWIITALVLIIAFILMFLRF